MTRKFVKVHENTSGIKVVFHKLDSTIDVNEKYVSNGFRRYEVNDIIYDEHVIACFYSLQDHYMNGILSEQVIDMMRLFARCGMTSIIDGYTATDISMVIYPNDKVKIFKI